MKDQNTGLSHKRKMENGLKKVLVLIPLIAIGLIIHMAWLKGAKILWQDVSEMTFGHISLVLFSLFLLPINYGLEGWKWKELLASPKIGLSISLKRAILSVCSGNTLGLVSPNRTGDVVGRVWSLPEGYKMVGVWATFLNGLLLQSAIFMVAGLFLAIGDSPLFSIVDTTNSILISPESLKGFIEKVEKMFFVPFWIIFFGTGIGLVLISSIIQPIQVLIIRKNWLTRFPRVNSLLNNYPNFSFHLILKIWLLSIIRVIVYSLQYVFILLFFGKDLNINFIFWGVGFLYLAQTLIFLPPILGFAIRGELAIGLWHYIGMTTGGALLSTLFIWVLNLMLPALIGGIFMLEKAEIKHEQKGV
jgi:hypothetical protein